MFNFHRLVFHWVSLRNNFSWAGFYCAQFESIQKLWLLFRQKSKQRCFLKLFFYIQMNFILMAQSLCLQKETIKSLNSFFIVSVIVFFSLFHLPLFPPPPMVSTWCFLFLFRGLFHNIRHVIERFSFFASSINLPLTTWKVVEREQTKLADCTTTFNRFSACY